MPPKDIKVSTSIITFGSDNVHYLLCNMTDGSMYRCKIDGTEWEKITPSLDELTEKFKAEIK